MVNKNYRDKLESFLTKNFVATGFNITKPIALDPVRESSKYEALTFALDEKNIAYRKGKITPDRPGAFLAIWQRPATTDINDNKPIPLTSNQLDYLFIQVQNHTNDEANKVLNNSLLNNSATSGMFIFPVSMLIEKGIVSSTKSKGKTGFRVFPPWSQNRGSIGTKVFSESAKKTQQWQLPYFLEINKHDLLDSQELNKIFSSKRCNPA